MFRNFQIAYLRRHVKVKEAMPLSFLRQSVGYTLSHAAREIPHAAATTTFDVTPLVEYGKADPSGAAEELDEKQLFKRALKRNFSAFFVKALSHCLYHVPAANGFLEFSLLRNGGTLYKAEDINVSFTVHTNAGVIKPIIRNPHQKDLTTVAEEMRVLARKARRTDADMLYRKAARVYTWAALRELDFRALPGLWMFLRDGLFPRTKPDPKTKDIPPEEQLQVEDILGSTCTLANIGMMMRGHQTVTVIIPPEVTMFGIGDLHLAPGIHNGEVVPRWHITICGTMDHRAFDAGEIFPLNQRVRKYINDPGLIYEWKPGDPI